MYDVECPYCGAEQDINHDDGYGYDESRTYEQQCDECEKNFAYTTTIHYHYEAEKADCLNGEPHNLEKVLACPDIYPDWVRCKDCGYQERGKYKESLETKEQSHDTKQG